MQNSDDTIVYLLKILDFNNKNSFKGYELNHISVEDIQNEMEKYVQNLPIGSPHLRSIRISSTSPKEFKLSFGQINCLKTTLDLIVEHIKNLPDVSQESHHPAPVRQPRERVIREVDLLNIQQIWDTKLSQALLKQRVVHGSFPIIRSLTQEFPYKFFLKCPKCHKQLTLTITKPNINSQPHFRFVNFTKHVVICMKQ